MTDKTPNIGVVGVGHLGRHHVKHLSNNNNALLAGIYDIDSVRVQDIAAEFNCRVFNSLNNLLDECDDYEEYKEYDYAYPYYFDEDDEYIYADDEEDED